jgi:PTS system mannose-specific IIA component
MIGIIVVTHGRLANELIAATEHVVGPMDRVRAVSIGAEDDLKERRDALKIAVSAVDEGDGVVIVTDMFGSTPGNLAVSLLDKARVEVLAGANLPMMVRLAEAREDMGLADAASAAREAGCRYVTIAKRAIHGDAA